MDFRLLPFRFWIHAINANGARNTQSSNESCCETKSSNQSVIVWNSCQVAIIPVITPSNIPPLFVMIPSVRAQRVMNMSILSLWPCFVQRFALRLLANQYRGGIRLMGAGKAASFSLQPPFFLAARIKQVQQDIIHVPPFWPEFCLFFNWAEPHLCRTHLKRFCATSLICTERKREKEGDAANRPGKGPKWGGAHWDVGGESGRPSDPSTHGAVCNSSWGERGEEGAEKNNSHQSSCADTRSYLWLGKHTALLKIIKNNLPPDC